MEEWIRLPATEEKEYLTFHELTYKEDLQHAEKNVLEFPRWSIISGYYAMHDVTKLFLAKEGSIKITSPRIHEKTILAIEHFVKDDSLKNKLLASLNEAKQTFYNVERLKEKAIPLLLKKGRAERVKSQYYVEDYAAKSEINAKKASYFLETVVKPYIAIMERLMK